MKVLITGGAGFIGFHLGKYLANEGYKVTLLDNFSRGVKDQDLKELISNKNVKLIKADITEKESFSKLHYLLQNPFARTCQLFFYFDRTPR